MAFNTLQVKAVEGHRVICKYITNYFKRNDFKSGRNDLGRNDFELGRNDLGRNGLGAKRPVSFSTFLEFPQMTGVFY